MRLTSGPATRGGGLVPWIAPVRALAALVLLLAARSVAASPAPQTPGQQQVAWEQKMSWILRLEDQRILRDPAPPAPVPPSPALAAGARDAGRRPAATPVAPQVAPPAADLVRLLTDGEARVRRRASLAVGRVGLAEGIAPLARVLSGDAEAEVRQMAAFALGLIGQPGAVEALKAALADASPIVQGRAAEALGAIGDAASAAPIAAMAARQMAAGKVAAIDPDELAYPLAPEVEAFRLAIFALARLKATDALIATVLDGAGYPRVRWWPVAFALSRVDAARATPALLSLLGGPGSLTRSFAARGLQTSKDAGAAGALLLRAQGWQDDGRAALASVRALGQLGAPESASVLRGLLAVRQLDPNLRLETVTALGGVHDAAAVDRLIDLTGDPWPAMRLAALRAIREIDQDTFFMVLSGLGGDAHWSVRAGLATTLGSVDAARAVPALMAMIGERDVRVLPSVIDALAKLAAPELGPHVLRFLAHEDVMVRASAASAIGALRLPGGDAALAAAYRAAGREGLYQARAAALAAIAKFGTAAAMPVLREALADRDWAVRLKAAAIVRELDPAADLSAAIRPAPGRPADEYASPAILAPRVSPHIFLETDKGTVEIELAVLDAPQASASFLALARSGAFSGVAIHRVVANFVVQDGDNRGDGEGGPGYTIRDEINERPYLRGTVGMALDGKDTGGSQYFITHSPQPHLDGRYTVFGQVVAGMDVVDRLQQWDVIRRVRTWDGAELTVR